MADDDTQRGVQPETTEDTDAEGGAEQAPEFQNRAARRARGKGSTTPPPAGAGGVHGGGRGSVQGPRQWGNRRSG